MAHPTPAYLHHVVITDDAEPRSRLPAVLQENIRSLTACYPDAEHRLWSTPALEELLAAHFEPEVLDTFRSLRAFAYKADLARLCIVYVLGGLYSDIGLRFARPIVPHEDFGLVTFQDIQNGAPLWCAVSNAIIWCRPGRPELRIAIDMIVRNCRERYYGPVSVYVSGPAVFGEAIIQAMAAKDLRANPHEYYIGHIHPVYPFTVDTAILFVTPDRAVVATRQKSISQIKDGSLKTNDYGEIWQARRAYGETEVTWPATDGKIQVGPGGLRTATGIVSVPDAHDLVAFGPYIHLEPGRYGVRPTFDQGSLPALKMEITSECGVNLLGVQEIEAAEEREDAAYETTFSVEQSTENVEFRLSCRGTLRTELRSLVLREMP